MDRKRLGWVLVALGAVLVFLPTLDNPLSLAVDDDAVSYKEWTGVVVGGVLIIAGLAVMYVKRRGADSDQTDT